MATAGDIVLTVVTGVFLLLIIVASIFGLAHLQDPLERKAAWFPKVVCIMAAVTSAVMILLLPLDVAGRKPVGTPPFIPVYLLTLIAYGLSLFLLAFLIPLAFLHYDALEEPEHDVDTVLKNASQGRSSAGASKQLFHALKWTLPFTLALVALVGGLYYAYGYSRLPTAFLESVGSTVAGRATCVAAGDCLAWTRFMYIRINPLLYGVAIVNLIGMVFLMLYGGVGLICLPLDLLRSFINRPRAMSISAVVDARARLYTRSQELTTEAQKLLAERDELRAKGGFLKNLTRSGALDSQSRRLAAKVFELEEQAHKLEIARSISEESVLVQFFKLALSIIGFIFSILWLLHLALYFAPVTFGMKPVSAFMNAVFAGLSKVPFLGPAFYAIFALHLLLCLAHGSVRLGRLSSILGAVHSIRPGRTLTSALLFHSWLLVAGAQAVSHAGARVFGSYARDTASGRIANTQLANLSGGVGHGFDALICLMGVMAVVTALLACILPARKRKKKVKLVSEKERARNRQKENNYEMRQRAGK